MAEINIYGYIGADFFSEGVTLKSVSDQLKAFKDESEIIVNISSGGGSVNEGKAIYNLLKNSKKTITVNIIGQAYSIASVIAMAGDKIYIAEFGDIMIHPAWVDWAQGNAEDLREIADQLEQVSDELFSIYLTRASAKSNETKLREYFDSEKFIKADEAVELGLCDGILEDKKNRIREFVKYKAVAYYSNKNTDMEFDNKKAKSLLDEIKAWFSKVKGEVKNASTTAGDTTFYYEGNLEVGTKVFSDEAMTNALADGTYGDYTCADGAITAIAAVEDAVVTDLKNQIAELQAKLNAEIEAKAKAENDKLEAEAKMKADLEAVNSKVAELENLFVEKQKPENQETPKPMTEKEKFFARLEMTQFKN